MASLIRQEMRQNENGTAKASTTDFDSWLIKKIF
jgi:hypothetical protein